jgi:hypothetical protein
MVAELRARIVEIIEGLDLEALDPIALGVEFDCTRLFVELEIADVMREEGR